MTAGFSYLLSDGRLAQGAALPPDVRLPFDVIVLAAMEYQPDLPGYRVLRVPLDDGPPPDSATRARIRGAARRVAECVRAGDRVLVTCWQGKNRSGVIAGLALAELGVPGARAAQRIRRLRGGLTNPHFYAMVVCAR
jgi:protein-tyrosine phosphatase